MLRFLKPVLTLCVWLLLFTAATAQDSSAIKGWNVESKKTGEGKYELVFTVPLTNGWQLYAPNQLFLDVKTTELKFVDSSIIQEGDFVLTTAPKKINSTIIEGLTIDVFQDNNVEWKANIFINGTVPAKLQCSLFYTYGKGDEFYPSSLYSFVVGLEGGVESSTRVLVPSINIAKPVNNCGDEGTKNKSIISIFLLGLAGGLIALLTPCVFPMIPVTVTFFTKKSQDKKKGIFNGVLYGLFIFLIYVLITVPFHIASNTSPEIFNNISTNVWLNLLFFAVFVTFALSFFGLFEIGLPAGLANKMDSKSGLGDLAGIFFMAATLAIVSFSCTGPILGTLLVGVADQGAWPLTAGAAGFGIALGLPFALFAMFPHWLQSLPRSGGWMTDVKVILGFVELALAVKFFSNADLVKQWGLLKREVFIGIWVVIGILAVLYLLGKIKFAHSSPVKKFSFTRISFIVLFGAITLYLLPGLTNTKWADLKIISGFPPPRTTYSIYNSDHSNNGIFEPIQNNYAEALALAKKENKPVLIDFTGWACVNCRRMEEKVWPDPVVDSLMRHKFIVVSLYVDERRNLPLTEQTVVSLSNGSEKSIVTVGDKWSTFQTENFGATSQPQYAIISSDEKALTKTKYYTPSAANFIAWLQCGLDAFSRQSAVNKSIVNSH
ncbi:MAG: thioredoxin family protein [Chitinophagaceae bacterium]